MSERMGPERASRLLRAKVGELENIVNDAMGTAEGYTAETTNELVIGLVADIALVASILADLIDMHVAPTDVE
jgi:hypothetical protein